MTAAPLQLIEPVPIEDELCAGLALIEDAGVGFRLVYYAQQTCYETGTTLNVVKRKLIVPFDAIDKANKSVRAYLDERMAGRKTLRLV